MTSTTSMPTPNALDHVPPRRSRQSSPFAQLVLTNWRELVREPKTLFFSMIFPFIFLAMFSAIGVLVDQGGEPAHVTVSTTTDPATSAAVSRSLQAHGIEVIDAAQAARANVTLSVSGSNALVTLGASGIANRDIVSALRDTGLRTSNIAVLTPDGAAVFDPVKGSLPTVLMLGLLSLAFLGTAAPLVGLRGRGTLRLLGTTPVRRRTFVLAQTPPRLILGGVQVTVIAAYAAYLGYLDLGSSVQLLTTCALGLVMLLAIGYLFASRMTSQDLATTIASLFIPVAMIFAGSMLPTQLLPPAVSSVTQYLPTTILSEALGVSLVGDTGGWSLTTAWAVMGGIAILATAAASALFSWDQGDKR